MKRDNLVLLLLLIIASGLSGCRWGTTEVHAGELPTLTVATPPRAEIRCSRPVPANAATCKRWEQEILSATVRVALSGWLASAEENTATWTRLDREVGHGTVMDGRYIVTHNHFEMPFDLVADGRVAGLVSLFTSSGDPIAINADINDVSVVYEDSHTLVLAFPTESGAGFFETAGQRSATFQSWDELNFQVGEEVAQIDWDGRIAHVDWAEIRTLIVDDETPSVDVANFNELGSSGGGVFRNGVHIGNNWQRTTVESVDNTTNPLRWSSAALNAPFLVNFGSALAQATLTPGPAN